MLVELLYLIGVVMKEIVSNAIDSLKAQPVMLALVLINVLFLLFVAFIAHRVTTDNAEERKTVLALMQQCLDLQRPR